MSVQLSGVSSVPVQLGNEVQRCKFEYQNPNLEWSERDERHGRQSCEGSSERARAANEFQTITQYSKREEHAERGCRRVDGQMREGSARAKGIRESKLETKSHPF